MMISDRKTQTVAPRFGRLDADMAEVDSSIDRSRDFLLSRQHPEGFFFGYIVV